MNIKKIAITAAAAGMVLSAAVPALAWGGRHGRSSNDLELEIENENTTVRNNVLTLSNTGFNEVEGGHSRHHRSSGGGSINTGNAGATSDVLNQVNTNTVDLCGCLGDRRGDVEVEIENEDTDVTNNVLTVSNTGFNEVNGRGRIRTGNAGATGLITNVVNTNVVN